LLKKQFHKKNVIPAQAGIQIIKIVVSSSLDARFRGHDEL
jgi:hypothetical protein